MVNVKDFGAVGDDTKLDTNGKPFDDYPAFRAALNFLLSDPHNVDIGQYYKGLYQGSQRLYIPAGHYFLSKTLDIKSLTLIIEGDSCGGIGGLGSVLHWQQPMTGIRIQNTNTSGVGLDDQPSAAGAGKGANATIIRNLSLLGTRGVVTQGVLDPDAIPSEDDEMEWFHGIHARARCVVEDVSVEGFSHSGIFIHAVVSGAEDNVIGNANCFTLSRIVTHHNGVAGLWVQGNDANAGTVTQLSSMANGQYGIYDESFLGNTYVGCHTQGNGNGHSKAKVYTQVSDNTNRYHVFHGQTALASENAPDAKIPTIWRLLGPGGSTMITHLGSKAPNILIAVLTFPSATRLKTCL